MESCFYIDVGSTNIKWQDKDGKSGSEKFPDPLNQTVPFFEVSIREIGRIVTSLILSHPAEKVFISTQMHGYVLLDKGGEPVTEYISWQDTRSTLVHNFPFQMSPENGVGMKENLPRAGVYAIKLLRPEQYNKASEFCTLGSYLSKILTGNNCTHISDAAPSGFYNVKTGEGKSELILPQVKMRPDVVGIFEGRKIYTPIGDQQASILGCGGDEESYIMNLGTTGQLCCIEKGFSIGEFESRPYFNGSTLCTVTNLMAGKKIQKMADGWEDCFYKEYSSALQRLPKRNKIIITGGVTQYYHDKVEKLVRNFKFPYTFSPKQDAIEGLKRVAEEII